MEDQDDPFLREDITPEQLWQDYPQRGYGSVDDESTLLPRSDRRDYPFRRRLYAEDSDPEDEMDIGERYRYVDTVQSTESPHAEAAALALRHARSQQWNGLPIMALEARQEHIQRSVNALNWLWNDRNDMNKHSIQRLGFYLSHLYLLSRIAELEERLFREKLLELPTESALLPVIQTPEFQVLMNDLWADKSIQRGHLLASWLHSMIVIKSFILLIASKKAEGTPVLDWHQLALQAILDSFDLLQYSASTLAEMGQTLKREGCLSAFYSVYVELMSQFVPMEHWRLDFSDHYTTRIYTCVEEIVLYWQVAGRFDILLQLLEHSELMLSVIRAIQRWPLEVDFYAVDRHNYSPALAFLRILHALLPHTPHIFSVDPRRWLSYRAYRSSLLWNQTRGLVQSIPFFTIGENRAVPIFKRLYESCETSGRFSRSASQVIEYISSIWDILVKVYKSQPAVPLMDPQEFSATAKATREILALYKTDVKLTVTRPLPDYLHSILATKEIVIPNAQYNYLRLARLQWAESPGKILDLFPKEDVLRKMVAEVKLCGNNVFFAKNNFNGAIIMYSVGIDLAAPADPELPLLYSNRSQSQIELNNMCLSILDSRKTLELKPDHEKTRNRLVDANTRLTALMSWQSDSDLIGGLDRAKMDSFEFAFSCLSQLPTEVQLDLLTIINDPKSAFMVKLREKYGEKADGRGQQSQSSVLCLELMKTVDAALSLPKGQLCATLGILALSRVIQMFLSPGKLTAQGEEFRAKVADHPVFLKRLAAVIFNTQTSSVALRLAAFKVFRTIAPFTEYVVCRLAFNPLFWKDTVGPLCDAIERLGTNVSEACRILSVELREERRLVSAFQMTGPHLDDKNSKQSTSNPLLAYQIESIVAEGLDAVESLTATLHSVQSAVDDVLMDLAASSAGKFMKWILKAACNYSSPMSPIPPRCAALLLSFSAPPGVNLTKDSHKASYQRRVEKIFSFEKLLVEHLLTAMEELCSDSYFFGRLVPDIYVNSKLGQLFASDYSSLLNILNVSCATSIRHATCIANIFATMADSRAPVAFGSALSQSHKGPKGAERSVVDLASKLLECSKRLFGDLQLEQLIHATNDCRTEEEARFLEIMRGRVTFSAGAPPFRLISLRKDWRQGFIQVITPAEIAFSLVLKRFNDARREQEAHLGGVVRDLARIVISNYDRDFSLTQRQQMALQFSLLQVARLLHQHGDATNFDLGPTTATTVASPSNVNPTTLDILLKQVQLLWEMRYLDVVVSTLRQLKNGLSGADASLADRIKRVEALFEQYISPYEKMSREIEGNRRGVRERAVAREEALPKMQKRGDVCTGCEKRRASTNHFPCGHRVCRLCSTVRHCLAEDCGSVVLTEDTIKHDEYDRVY